MARPGGYFRVPVKKAPAPVKRSAPIRPRPEVAVGPPAPRPSAAPRTARTVFQKPIGAVSPVGQGRSTAGRQQRAAANRLPAEHQLPRFPVLRQYSEPQRQFIRQHTETAIRKVAAQRGLAPSQATQVLYSAGDHHTRQTLRTYGRVVREQQQISHAKALGALADAHPSIKQAVSSLGPLSTAQKSRVYQQLAAVPKSQARPGLKPRGGLTGGGLATLATIKGFALSPNRNLLVAAAPGFKGLAGPLVRDAVSLPRDVVNSAYFAVTNPKGAAKAFVNHDPLALAAQGRFHEALVATGEHPLDTVLEVGGARGLARGAGRVARIPTRRAAAIVPGTSLAEPRAYSTSPITQAAQRALERRRITKSESLQTQAKQAEAAGNLEQADALYHHAAEVDPRIASQHYIEHRADVREGLSQPGKRRGRAEIKANLKPLVAPARDGGHAQRLIVEGHAPIRTNAAGTLDVGRMRQDLHAYGQRLETEAANLKGRELAVNRRLRSRVAEAQKLPDAKLTELATKSRGIAQITNAQETRNVAAGMLDPREAQIARLKTYAVQHMNARVKVETHRLEAWQKAKAAAQESGQPFRTPRPQAVLTVAEKGRDRILTPDQIVSHMKANGVNPADVAFVSQRNLGPGSFNVRSLGAGLNAKGLTTQTRTGAAVIKGQIDTHPRNLEANAVRMQQFEAAHKNYSQAIAESGARYPQGHPQAGELRQFNSKAEAQKFVDNAAYDEKGNRIHGAPAFRVVRINPWGGRESQLRDLLDHANPDGFTVSDGAIHHPISQAIEEAVSGRAKEGDGPFAVVPEAYANRIAAHSEVYRSVDPTLRAITGFFRNTVLPLSTSWLTGNVSEAALRAAIKSPRVIHNLKTYRRVLAEVERFDPEEAGRIKDMIGVGHYGMTESSIYTSLPQFARSSRPVQALALALHKLRHTPGPKHLADAYAAYAAWVFHSVNSRLETPFREAIAGAHIRKNFGDPGSIGMVSQRAVEDAAKGLRDTNAQVKMADEIRRAYGSYESHSPEMRRRILLYSPFLPWSVNAVKFVASVLPRDHPVLTAVIAAQNRAAADWRKQHGLDEYGPNPVPPFLMGSIPVGGGGHKNIARYTPFGAFGNPGDTAASLLLPQFSGALHALQGQKWTGQPLHGGTVTTSDRFGAAFMQELQSLVPGYAMMQRAAASSNPADILNPVRTIKKRASKKTSSGGGGAFGGLPGGSGGSASFGGLPG